MSSSNPVPMRKSFGKSDGFREFKLAFKRLAGKEPRFRMDLRVPLEQVGGWWICSGLMHRGLCVYSLGVGEDIDFDLAVINRHGAEVFAFDPTPNSITWLEQQNLPEQFHFFPWAVTDSDGSLYLYPRVRGDGSQSRVMYTLLAEPAARSDGIEVPARTINSILNSLGHDRIDLLKMDIEGAEYGVLKNLLESPLRPTQLLVEFHHRFPALTVNDTRGAVASLREAGYGLARISSSGREYTFIHVAALGASATHS